ncbi:SMI1/KNR4 family protein [Listeria rocourtiae]|uniref:SMI1/KNR4 family protein n=1 Tax=Listeria rocourtiae TaxID=647910 RepID=UPI00162A21B0|nr:SMI1/KNR4 family protein [Listeria rocourtiae]MBC1435487.1 SMI1/KNR4 family protein [Listeria rocourtiae]MBC1604903.1 SMI1/KNR4 family protein [Listeria rocourtiae]
MKYNFLTENPNNKFYPVDSEDIDIVQTDLDIIFPQELFDMYTNIGYRFIKGSRHNVNRLMDPLSVRDFRLKQNDFELFPDIDVYDDLEDELIFFEANETAMISIKLVDSESSPIYYDEFKIANSLAEFLQKVALNKEGL